MRRGERGEGRRGTGRGGGGGGASPVVVRVLVLTFGQCHEIGLTGHGSVGGLVLAGGGRCREYHRGERRVPVRAGVCVVCPADRGSARFGRHAACARKPAPPHRMRRPGGGGEGTPLQVVVCSGKEISR